MRASHHNRHALMLLLAVLCLVAFLPTWAGLLALAKSNEKYTHVVFMPAIAAVLIIAERRRIFHPSLQAPGVGPALLAITVLLGLSGLAAVQSQSGPAPLAMRAALIVIALLSAFLFAYGVQSGRSAIFPLCLLAAIIPLPAAWMEGASIALQQWSAEVSHVLYKVLQVPVFREGMRFSLPGLNIEVAEECSGIRSAIGLLVAAAVAAHLLLRTGFARLALILLVIPITVCKNAVRIVALSVLGAYVSRDFIEGPFHRNGGPLFAVLSFAMLGLALFLLMRWEHRLLRTPSPRNSRNLTDHPIAGGTTAE